MIVAVDDFNMGAMENKGLNIFNSRYVLASPETATDADYKSIETIIAHEYFHNWTGNRITCRDWFQLCLKEGLTVFRDQQFSAVQRSAGVKRIEDVLRLRAAQFREDAGPLAHPVRPEEYIEINNFYTATVYEKGAELIGMLRRLVGPETYAKALDLYFERHDGAGLHDRGLAARSSRTPPGATSRQFKRWYSQAGTPRLSATEAWDGAPLPAGARAGDAADAGTAGEGAAGDPGGLRAARPGRRDGGGGRAGADARRAQTFEWELPARPVPSLLRGFSAPVILERADDARPSGRSCSPTTPTRSTSGRPGAPRRWRCSPGWRRMPPRRPIRSSWRRWRRWRDDAGARPRLQGAAARPALRGRGDRPHAPRRAACPIRWRSGRHGGGSRRRSRARARRPGGGALCRRTRCAGRYSPDAAAAGRRALRGAGARRS